MPQISKHAFGSKANIETAKEAGTINERDVLFLDNREIGWIDGEEFLLPIQNYDYTKLQAIFCPFNTSLEDSVAADRVVIDDKVYPVGSAVFEGAITVNHELGRIEFGVTNNSGKTCVIRYSTYKEIY